MSRTSSIEMNRTPKFEKRIHIKKRKIEKVTNRTTKREKASEKQTTEQRKTNNHTSKKKTWKKKREKAPPTRRWAPRSPKTTPGTPQNGAKRGRRGTKKRPETARRPKKPITGDHMTALDPPKAPVSAHAHARHFLEAFLYTKTTQERPKTIKHRSEKARGEEKRSKTIKDPSCSDLGRCGGATSKRKTPTRIEKHTISWQIDFSLIR